MTDDMPSRNDYIALSLFGKDHWSTFAYVETRIVDHGAFVIQCDPRMRTLAHNWRIFNHHRVPHRAVIGQRGDGPDSDNVKYGTLLNNNTRVAKHDDWDCLQDLAAAGLLIGDATEEPLRLFDAKMLDEFDKIVAQHDRAARVMIAEFIRQQNDFGLDVGAQVYLTATGFRCVAALRMHKANGGQFHEFRWANNV